MWMAKNVGGLGGGAHGTVAVAIHGGNSSQHALKWAVHHLLQRGQSVTLIHVKLRTSLNASSANPEFHCRQVLLRFHVFCARKDIQHKDVLLEESDVAKALVEYVNQAGIEKLVIGTSCRSGFFRFNKPTDISDTIMKTARDLCTIYVISKGKIATMRSGSKTAPSAAPPRAQLLVLSLVLLLGAVSFHQVNLNPPQLLERALVLT